MASLGAADLTALVGANALFVGGLLGLQWRATRRLAPERVVAIAVTASLCWGARTHVPGLVTLALVAVIAAIKQAITSRRWDRLNAGEAARVPPDPGLPS
jgi:hypothetical protein